MEIVFDEVNYKSKKSFSGLSSLNNFSLSIKSGSIVGIVSEDVSLMYDLLVLNKRPSSGVIKVGEISIKRSNSVKNKEVLKQKVGYVTFKLDFLCKTVEDEIISSMNNHSYVCDDIKKHVVDSLVIAGLNEKFLDCDPNSLSYTEQKKLQLAKELSFNPSIIFVEGFDKHFSYREKDYFKKLFRKLKIKFNKTIILVASNIELFFDIVDRVFVIENGNLVINGDKNIFYKDEIYDYVEVPKIVEFTNYVNNLGYDINEYVDLKELIKELYRKIK